MSKCPVPKGFKIPRLTDTWSEKLSSHRKSMPTVAFTLPRPNQQWGQLENQDPQSYHPPINFRNPQKFT